MICPAQPLVLTLPTGTGSPSPSASSASVTPTSARAWARIAASAASPSAAGRASRDIHPASYNGADRMRRTAAAAAAVLALAAPASGCAGSLAARKGASDTGLCAYYSASLVGRRTASGEPYDPAGLTAAHRTLPFGTMVRVTRVGAGA